MNLYVIYDVKADAIKPNYLPFENDDVCKRAFKGVLAQPPQPFEELARYPEDFFVYRVASLDLHSTGSLSVIKPVRVFCLNDLKVVS